MKKFLLAGVIICTTLTFTKAQTFIGDTLIVTTDNDTLALPFPMDHSKRLQREDIINKKEGWYMTGLPELTIDPIRGFSVGGNAFLFNNRDRNDPFFYFTPYRTMYSVALNVAQNGRVNGAFSLDMPFAFNSRWRLRGDFIYENDPNWQYFGLGRQTLRRLSYTDKQTGQFVDNARFNNYYSNLQRTRSGRGAQFGEDPNLIYTDAHYNELNYTEFLTAAAAERTYFEGRLRVMLGYEMLITRINHYDFDVIPDAVNPLTGEETEALQGRTLITEDYEAKQRGDADSYWLKHNIGGYHGGRIGLAQFGLMWDTRDLETDPSNGIFAEFANEVSAPFTGSQFNFTKHLLQGIFYQRLLPEKVSRMVLTGRFALGYIRGSSIPFTEVMDLWSASEQGGIHVLGGAYALRGYREARFVGRVTALANMELRTRFYQRRILNQHLAFYVVPFYDAGSIWDSFRHIEINNFRGNPGLGARIVWNQATILRFDYARSREDSQFFFVFGHTF
ncbi:MAG: Omp85 family outer membrane protein [Cytophagaceae bacterium]